MRINRKELNILIGKRLKNVRENNGYTQEKFAEVFDVGVEHYRKLESGVYGLQLEKMLIVYRVFKIDPTYLITGEKIRILTLKCFLLIVIDNKETNLLNGC